MNLFMVIGIVLLIFGVVTAFWGYRLHALFRFLAGFGVGAMAGFFALSSERGKDLGMLIVIPLLLGVILGVICVVLKRVWVFIECFGYGFVLTAFLIIRSSVGPVESVEFVFSILMDRSYALTRIILPAALAGCAAGVVGIFIWRIWIILSTGLWGGVLSCAGLVCLKMNFTIAATAALLIAVFGIVCQFVRTGKARRRVQESREPWPVQPHQPEPWSGQRQLPHPEPWSGQQQPVQPEIWPGQRQPVQPESWSGQRQPSQPAPWSGQQQPVQPESWPGQQPAAAAEEAWGEAAQEVQDAEAVLFCSQCGNRLGENEIFCPECGKKVR